MIGTALKHLVLELCIEQIFHGIMRNFSSVKDCEILKSLVPGKRLSLIYYMTETGKMRTYYKPMVKRCIPFGHRPRVVIEYSNAYNIFNETESGGEFRLNTTFLRIDGIIGAF